MKKSDEDKPWLGNDQPDSDQFYYHTNLWYDLIGVTYYLCGLPPPNHDFCLTMSKTPHTPEWKDTVPGQCSPKAIKVVIYKDRLRHGHSLWHLWDTVSARDVLPWFRSRNASKTASRKHPSPAVYSLGSPLVMDGWTRFPGQTWILHNTLIAFL